ncbi:uncharacterized protein LOC127249005 [Andrographis paniculata]|uniref:uncharacterized protein LOC127249005 n=1 Tax=Andrographis paniculata TaxID=175694 RepID=UPI0021E9434F|nr:uncharacterized protein LOC127249005 [Andrographis paniculata]
MEKMHQQQWWRAVKSRLTYKNATLVVCLCNVIAALFLLHCVFFHPSSSRSAVSQKALLRHMKESEDIRRSMVPVDLIRRVREIREEEHAEAEEIQQKDVKVKQTAAVDLISRLNNFRSYSDPGSVKAIEEWRRRKMERARQRSLVKNGTGVSSS